MSEPSEQERCPICGSQDFETITAHDDDGETAHCENCELEWPG